MLRKQFTFARHSLFHFLRALQSRDIGTNSTNRVRLTPTITQRKFYDDVVTHGPVDGYGLLELKRSAPFNRFTIVVLKFFGEVAWKIVIVGFANHLSTPDVMEPFKFTINQEIVQTEILDEHDRRRVVHNIL